MEPETPIERELPAINEREAIQVNSRKATVDLEDIKIEEEEEDPALLVDDAFWKPLFSRVF